MTTTIEQTGKSIKACRAFGWLALCISIIGIVNGEPWGGILLFSSMFWLLGTRIARWWFHG
jgi:hypothetical protein